MKTYRSMWRMISYRPGLYIVNALLWSLIHLSPLIPGLIAQQFFNRLPQVGGLNAELWTLIMLLVVTALGRVVIIFSGGWIDSTHRFNMRALLRRNLLARILERPGARAVPYSPGEAISRMRDDVMHAEDAISWTLDMIGNTLFAIVAIIILLRISVTITLLVFVPLVCIVALVQLMSKRLESYRKASSQATSRVTSAIGEMFTTVQAIQVAGAENNVISNLHTLNEQRRVTAVKDQFMEQLLNSTFGNTVGLGTGLILILAAQSVRTHQLGLGDLALFIYYLSFVADYTQFFGMFLAHYTQTKVAFARMETLMQGAPSEQLVAHHPLYLAGTVPALTSPVKSAAHEFKSLAVTALSYRYPDTGRGIADISLRVPRGSLTVITGRIGSGKTTLLQVLLGLLPKDTGEIRWNGELVEDAASFFVPPRTAYTAQIPRLFSASLKENILLGLPEDAVDLPSAIHAAVMEQDITQLEDGLETLVGSRGVKLSGGQAQRAAAARMFVRDAELFVFDDLSSALDVETEQQLWERLFHRGGRTCLVVSHRRAVLQRADHIILLKEGHLEATGTLETLLQDVPEMQRLWHGEALS